MSKIIKRATKPTPRREPQWWYKFLQTKSIVERDGAYWRLSKNYGFSVWYEVSKPTDMED